MAVPLPEGMHINVQRKIFHPGYAMSSMQMATDHYNIGYTISGDRKTIAPFGTYYYRAGDVTVMPPYIYHRTVSESDTPYERILIKFSPELADEFIKEMGQQVFDELFEQRVLRFTPNAQKKIEALFMDIAKEGEKDKPYKEFILKGMLFRIMVSVWEEKLPCEGEAIHKTPLTPPIVDALYYMEKYYNRNPAMEEAARVANFSPAYFSRLFSAQLGKSYSEYLSQIKLRHVYILLTQTNKSIMEIAQETGYCHGNYLSEQFKKKTGMTPGQYRKMRSTEK